jgi:hypothetical protein
MKAVLEFWVSKFRQFEGEDEIIVRNAFEFNGMGVPIQSVLVTGERVPAGEAGDALYHYKLLWIIEPMVSPTLGVTGSYPCTLRPTMSGLSRLRKAEIVYYDEDVQGMERAMHAEFAENSNVKFIREFFLPQGLSVQTGRSSPTKIGRRYGRSAEYLAQGQAPVWSD